MKQNSCSQCGGTHLVTGMMQSTGAIRFRPLEAKFLTFHTADVTVRANMCASCGWICLVGDTDKLQLVNDGSRSRAGVTDHTPSRT